MSLNWLQMRADPAEVGLTPLDYVAVCSPSCCEHASHSGRTAGAVEFCHQVIAACRGDQCYQLYTYWLLLLVIGRLWLLRLVQPAGKAGFPNRYWCQLYNH